MHTITIKVKKDKVYKSLLEHLDQYSVGDIEWNEFDDASLVELEEKISEGFYDIENGRLKKLDNVLAEARAKYGL